MKSQGPSKDADVVDSDPGDQAAKSVTASAALPADPLGELTDLIARLAALRRLREDKQSFNTEPTHQ